MCVPQTILKLPFKSSGVDTRIIVADFTNPSILQTIVTKIDEFKIDIGALVNNVGLLGGHAMPFLELEKSTVLDIINVNVTAATFLCHSLLPKMIAKGRGAIINLSSIASHAPCPYYTEYAATKHYLTAFTQALASEYSDSGVTIQCVEPGQVDTAMTKYFDKVFVFLLAKRLINMVILWDSLLVTPYFYSYRLDLFWLQIQVSM